MPRVWWHRIRRFVASSSRVLLIGAPATLITVAVKAFASDASLVIPWWLIAIGIVGVGLLVYQAWSEYQHRTYDPTWVFRFDDRFYDGEFREIRCRAAKVLKDNQRKLGRTDKDLDDIDEVLDFFEDIGFYVHGDQISPNVANHHFYHWIRGYYLAARDYIEAWQQQPIEPTRWNHVKELYAITSEIELEGKGKTDLEKDGILKFLDEEIDTCCKHNC